MYVSIFHCPGLTRCEARDDRAQIVFILIILLTIVQLLTTTVFISIEI